MPDGCRWVVREYISQLYAGQEKLNQTEVTLWMENKKKEKLCTHQLRAILLAATLSVVKDTQVKVIQWGSEHFNHPGMNL